MNNGVIEELDIRGNTIGVEGACVILQSAVNNEACQVVIKITDNYKGDNEVRTLMNIMEYRIQRRMKATVVGYL